MHTNSKSITFDQIQSDLEQNEEALNDATLNSSLDETIEKILKTKTKLAARKSSKIKFADPIIKHNENAVFFPYTINVIQGQNGVHKSRLAETICSVILKIKGCSNNLLNFETVENAPKYSILYVDTERNLNDQFPFALQSIQTRAGYQINENPPEFDYISLLEFPRKDRFDVLNKYLAYYRTLYADRPTFIVLDVSTDCIEDFNKSDKSMELIDHMNLAINTHNVVFLCLIHENPGSEKARGHFGTELINKASTVMRVDFEKDNNGPTDIIQVRYLKCRSTARHEPFYIRYCNEEKCLVLADQEKVEAIKVKRQVTAKLSEIIEYISTNLLPGSETPKEELIEALTKYIGGSGRTIESRLSELVNKRTQIISDVDQNTYILTRPKQGKHTVYTLKAEK
jgi:hypothetical protein